MSTIAFVFPGQGSQVVGMGHELAETSGRARETFEEADRTLGLPLSKLCFEGPEAILNDTTNSQPAVFTTSIAALEALGEAILGPRGPRLTAEPASDDAPRGVGLLPPELRPAYVAGHSLGEYSALTAAGVLSFKDALRLVAERGRLAATRGAKGAMAAVIGLDAATVEGIIRDAGRAGDVVVANDNGPTQVTIAGSDAGVEAVATALRAGGARKVVPLRISAPFHFPEMGRIADDLREFMRSLRFRDPVVPVVANIDALPKLRAADIPETLAKQLSTRVEWLRSVRFMVQQNVSTFVELGAGQVVNGLVKRIAEQAALHNVADSQSLAGTLRALGARKAT